MFSEADKTISATVRVTRLHRLGTRRLTRAHLALQRRPAVADAFRSAAVTGCAALKAQLAAPVEVTSRMLESAFALDRCLSADAFLALFELDATGTHAVVEIDRAVLCAAIDRISGVPARTAPIGRLTRIEETAFGFLMLTALQAVRGVPLVEKFFAPRLRSVNPSRFDVLAIVDGKVPYVAAQLLLKVGNVDGQARIFVPARSFQAVCQSEPAGTPGPIAPEILEAGLHARTFLGRAVLDAQDVDALRTGDVVLFERVRLGGGVAFGPGRLSAPGFELIGEFAADGFHLTRALARSFPQESSMSQPTPKDEAPTLPVDVEIELTRLRLTVGELANIRPGALLPLHINSSDPVTLRIGDRAIARAELVEIDGEVGARILALQS